MKELSIEEKVYDGNYKNYAELINRLEDVKEAIKKQNYGIAMDVLCKPYLEFQVTTHSELKESEDEMMIQYFKDLAPFDKAEELYEKYGFSHKDAIAWLEKQGEQKHTAEEVLIKAGLKPYKDGDQWCILLGDNIQEGICGFGNTIEDALYAFLKDLIASQSEQKLANSIWHDMTENPQGGENDRTLVVFEDGYSTTSNALLHIGFGTSKPYKWAYVNDILRLTSNAKQSEQKPANWLQELEDKLANATPKQLAEWKEKYFKEEPAEWSEEDDKKINYIIALLQNNTMHNSALRMANEEIEDWLKSLRPQNTWKPSDEQMNALNYVVNLMASSERPTENDLYYNILKSLRQQLKKHYL